MSTTHDHVIADRPTKHAYARCESNNFTPKVLWQFIFPQRLKVLKPHFTRLLYVHIPGGPPQKSVSEVDGSCRCVVEWKNRFFFIDPQKTKVNQKTYIDFLKTSLLPECRRLYPDVSVWFRLRAKQRSITPRQSNSNFSSRQHAGFH